MESRRNHCEITAKSRANALLEKKVEREGRNRKMSWMQEERCRTGVEVEREALRDRLRGARESKDVREEGKSR
jgi:hypothetical protein